MNNALKILKLNKHYINGGWDKWNRIVFYFAIALVFTGMGIQPFSHIFDHDKSSPPLYFLSIMSTCCDVMILMYIFGCFVPQKLIDGSNRKTRDLRNHFVYMPFTFEDYFIAGFISWLKWYLVSIIPVAYFIIVTCLTDNNPLTRECIGFAVTMNIIIYLVMGLCYLEIYSHSKLIKKLTNKLYTFSALFWVAGGILYGICYLNKYDLSVFYKLCSPLGLILTFAIIPVMIVLAKIVIIKNKGRSWFNE